MSLERRIQDALDLLEDAHATYASSPETVRKQLNRTVFAGVFLGPDGSDLAPNSTSRSRVSPSTRARPETTEAAHLAAA